MRWRVSSAARIEADNRRHRRRGGRYRASYLSNGRKRKRLGGSRMCVACRIATERRINLHGKHAGHDAQKIAGDKKRRRYVRQRQSIVYNRKRRINLQAELIAG